MFVYHGFKLIDAAGEILVIYPGDYQRLYFPTISKAKKFINDLMHIK